MERHPLAPRPWSASDADFPPALRLTVDPPVALWTLGDRSCLDAPCVAIVGTRRMTPYGDRVTRQLAASLARAGACVISGMARGVDATAHQATLEAGGRTAAVLGTGADVAYPPRHRHLHAGIVRNGLVVSEEHPGTPTTPGCFHRRNRIIAGLATLTVVVEAGFRSGANITVGHALTNGRLVAAVPGPIDAPQSQGCNLLLQQGAHCVTCPNDVLALMQLPPEPEQRPALGQPEASVWEVLGEEGGATVELIAARTALPLKETLAALTSLELEGLIVMDVAGTYRRG